MPSIANTAIASLVHAIHRALTHEGIQANTLFKQQGITLPTQEDEDFRLAPDKINDIWRAAKQATTNDAFSLKVIDYLQGSTINALLTSLHASTNIEQALALLQRFYPLLSPVIKLDVEIGEFVALKVSKAEDASLLNDEDVDITFGLITKQAAALTMNEIKPIRVTMKRKPSGNTEAHESFYNCPVEFNAADNILYFPVEKLASEIPSANASLSNVMEQYLSAESQKLSSQNIEQQVRQAILKALQQNSAPKLEQMAQALHLSKRSLQRKLSNEGLNFSAILTELRLELAQDYLLNQQLSIQEVSYRLGFTECSNFIRFFKQSLKCTPSDFVQKNQYQCQPLAPSDNPMASIDTPIEAPSA